MDKYRFCSFKLNLYHSSFKTCSSSFTDDGGEMRVQTISSNTDHKGWIILRSDDWENHGKRTPSSWCLKNQSWTMWAMWTRGLSSWETAPGNFASWDELSHLKWLRSLTMTWPRRVTVGLTKYHNMAAHTRIGFPKTHCFTRVSKYLGYNVDILQISPLLQRSDFMALMHLILAEFLLAMNDLEMAARKTSLWRALIVF